MKEQEKQTLYFPGHRGWRCAIDSSCITDTNIVTKTFHTEKNKRGTTAVEERLQRARKPQPQPSHLMVTTVTENDNNATVVIVGRTNAKSLLDDSFLEESLAATKAASFDPTAVSSELLELTETKRQPSIR